MSRKTLLLASGIVIPSAVSCIFISLIIKNLSPKYLYYVSENKNKLISGLIAGLVISFIVTAIAGYATYKELTKPKEAKNIEVQTETPSSVSEEQVITAKESELSNTNDRSLVSKGIPANDSGFSDIDNIDTDNLSSQSTSTPKRQPRRHSFSSVSDFITTSNNLNDLDSVSFLDDERNNQRNDFGFTELWHDDESYNDSNHLSLSNQQLLFEKIVQIDSSEAGNRVQDATNTQSNLAEELEEDHSASQFSIFSVDTSSLPEECSDYSLTNSEKESANNDDTFRRLESEVIQLENQLQQLKEKLNKSINAKEKLEKELDDALEAIDWLIKKQEDQIKAPKQQNETPLEENLQKLKSDNQELGNTEIKESKEDNSQQELLEAHKKNNELEERSSEITKKNEELQKELRKLSEKLDDLTDLEQQSKINKDLHQELQGAKNEFGNLEQNLTEKNQELKSTIENLKNQADDEDTLCGLRNEITELKELLQAKDRELESNRVALEVASHLDPCNKLTPPLPQLVDATLKNLVGINFSCS